jgi:septal ring factor EnvC (AmiA/AmiB activator)
MASSIMPDAHPGQVLSVVATLAVAGAAAIFFWPDNTDPQVSATLQNIRAGQQQTTSGIGATNDRPAAEKFLAQTRGTKAVKDSLAAEDLFMALSARLSALQDAVTRMQRDNAELAEQVRAIQKQMAQDNALVGEQLKALTQMAVGPPSSLRRAMKMRPLFSQWVPRRACGRRLLCLSHVRRLLFRSAGRSS